MSQDTLFGRLAFAGLPAPKILCVDDENHPTDSLPRLLSQHGFQPLSAHFGTKGIINQCDEKPDLIVTDLPLEKGQTTEAIAALQADKETVDIPIIVLTGCRESWIDAQLLELGAKAVLHKPVRIEELLACIRTHLGCKQVLAPGADRTSGC